ncbi:putative phospholipid-transporting ATPase ID [Platysternon megacephalum]|uniref:Putative phospholipid-transporting ATPase ID n=1 Tax=Platysternon megacephalum TaxID=55544 RepID=A0A4D9E376_9SAUR|nr:putative phospholipid-transporting ATPase ID [Platysternon megacephalum]
MICVQGLSHPGDPSRVSQPIWREGSSLKSTIREPLMKPTHCMLGLFSGPGPDQFGRRTDPLLGVAGKAGSESLVGPEQILPAGITENDLPRRFLPNQFLSARVRDVPVRWCIPIPGSGDPVASCLA